MPKHQFNIVFTGDVNGVALVLIRNKCICIVNTVMVKCARKYKSLSSVYSTTDLEFYSLIGCVFILISISIDRKSVV